MSVPLNQYKTRVSRNASDATTRVSKYGSSKRDSRQIWAECGKGTNDRNGSADENTSTDEDEDVIASRPRGRLARRMLADNENVQDFRTNEGRDTDDDAYQRVRKRLLQGRKGSTTTSGQKPVARSGPASNEHTEGDPNFNHGSGVQDDAEEAQEPSSPITPASNNPTPAASSPLIADTTHDSTHSAVENSDSDADLPSAPHTSARFLALVARKRQEREAREAQMKASAEKASSDGEQARNGEDDGQGADLQSERVLTQSARPTRKAGKKALEEMTRETQRLSRNMQLAHEARTKKKVTKQSLFERFNYKPVGYLPTPDASGASTQPSEADPIQDGGIELQQFPGKKMDSPHETGKTHSAVSEGHDSLNNLVELDELPSVDEIKAMKPLPRARSEHLQQNDASTRKAGTSDPGSLGERSSRQPQEAKTTKPLIRALRQKPITSIHLSDSDSDLEIIPKGSKAERKTLLLERFQQTKKTESQPLHALLTLAHLNQPDERQPVKGKNHLTRAELDRSLQRRARQQAAKALEERMQELRDKGIIVPTAEERAREEATIEDLFEKAKREAQEIARREKAAAKNGGDGDEQLDDLDGESDEDEDYSEENEEDQQVELSGSEVDDGSNEDDEEEEDQESEAEQGEETLHDESLVPSTLDEDAEQAATKNNEAEDQTAMVDTEILADDEADPIPQRLGRNRRKTAWILSDDEEDGDDPKPTPTVPQTPLSAKKPVIPGLPGLGKPFVGLTQAFACTMADGLASQPIDAEDASGVSQGPPSSPHDTLDFLRQPPAASLPELHVATPDPRRSEIEDLIMDSQPPPSQVKTPLLQSHLQNLPLQDAMSPTQASEFPDPTQDVGFAQAQPLLQRFVQASPASTVATVMVDQPATSPTVKRKGRLRRRIAMPAFSDDDEDEDADEDVASAGSDADDNVPNEGHEDDGDEENDFEISTSAFDVLRTGAKKQAGAAERASSFDKKTSKARDMIEEQAEESEDEYAGLGGASEDEDGNGEVADMQELRDMLDDDAQDVDESEIAAFYAYVFSTPFLSLAFYDCKNPVMCPNILSAHVETKTAPPTRNSSRNSSRRSRRACSAASAARATSIYRTTRTTTRSSVGG